MTTRAISAALAALAIGGLAACRDRATRAECARMMDRYVDLTIAEEPELAKLPKEQLAVVREVKRELKRADRRYRKVHDECEARVTRKEYSCAVDAKATAEWEACVE